MKSEKTSEDGCFSYISVILSCFAGDLPVKGAMGQAMEVQQGSTFFLLNSISWFNEIYASLYSPCQAMSLDPYCDR